MEDEAREGTMSDAWYRRNTVDKALGWYLKLTYECDVQDSSSSIIRRLDHYQDVDYQENSRPVTYAQLWKRNTMKILPGQPKLIIRYWTCSHTQRFTSTWIRT